MALDVYYVQTGQKINLAWRAESNKYSSIAATLGIKKATNSTTGLVFGANQPRLARVRLNFEGGGSQIVFCAPDKVADATEGGKLVGKTSNGKKIRSASLVGTRT